MDYNWENKNILIAEDKDINYLFLEKILEHTQAQLIRAKNGKEAVEICNDNSNIDIILMDIRMPEMDGYESTKQIKKVINIPIIMQTAYNVENGREKGYDYGCDEYIVKPININKFYAIIDKYIA